MSFEHVGVDDVAYMFQLVFDPATRFEPLDLIWIGPASVRDEAGASSRLLEASGVHDAPLGQRAILYWLVLRSETNRNGIDGFVWNAWLHLEKILDVFSAIGARAAVAELIELAAACGPSEDAPDPVSGFLRFRATVDGPFVAAADCITDVEIALRALAAERPAAFVDPRVDPPA